MCFVICIQVCVGVFCQLRIPDLSPYNSLHRAQRWSSYNCYSFFSYLLLGENGEKKHHCFLLHEDASGGGAMPVLCHETLN